MVPPSARDRFDEARLINIANGLTAARVLLVPVFAYLLISGRGKSALLVFAVCGLTDPLRLAIMVISRDLFILVGSFLYLLLLDSSDIQATGLSKANTVVQVLTVIFFLGVAAFPVETAALGAGTLPSRIVAWVCAVTTVGSGLQYMYIGIRKLSDA